MLEIKHAVYSVDPNINYIVNKIDEATELNINTQMIDDDISRLSSEIGRAKNKIDDNNIRALIVYLNKVKKNALKNDGVIEICWHIGMDNLPKSYPIQFINEQLYKINTANYIELKNNQKYVSIDMKELADIIAYEFIYRDIGETHASIEELLKDCRIIGYESSSVLTDKFKADGDDIYKLSQSMYVGETPYLASDLDKYLTDYFYTKQFPFDSKTTYKDVVNYSCQYANTVIVNNLVKNSVTSGIAVRPISVAPTYIDLIVNANNGSAVNIDKNIMDTISVQAFGRKFIINPKLTII